MSEFSRRTVVVMVVAALLGIASFSGHVVAQSCGVDFDPPRTITLPADLRPLIEQMLQRSPTFQTQWQELVTLPQLRLTVEVHPMIGPYRARSIVHRCQYGQIVALVELPPFVKRVELIAHEFEHVIEQVEGADLRRLARVHSSGVHDLAYGYETDRATEAGRRVAEEWSHPVPLCSAGLNRH
jgi:hypothetical protein